MAAPIGSCSSIVLPDELQLLLTQADAGGHHDDEPIGFAIQSRPARGSPVHGLTAGPLPTLGDRHTADLNMPVMVS